MADRLRRIAVLLDLSCVIAALVAGGFAAAWADAQFLRMEPKPAGPVPAAGWASAGEWPFRRFWHDSAFVLGPITLGAAAPTLRAAIASRGRSLRRPGALAVTVAVIVGGISALLQCLSGRPTFAGPPALSYDLRNALEFRVPGASWAPGCSSP